MMSDDVLQGADILGLALGNSDPSSSNLDEYVEVEIYFDGTKSAAERGEAAQFLQARLAEIFEILDVDLRKYLWQRDRFVLELDLDAPEARLVGHIRTGDGAEDEWFAVHLLRQLSKARTDVSCRVVDNDGELLLIEAALAAPRWVSPANAPHRCWIRNGMVHLLPKPRPPEPELLPLPDALEKLRSLGSAGVAKDAVQRAIDKRLEGYPKRAVELSTHTARAVLPLPVARAFLSYPQLVAVAVDHLPPPPTKELLRLRRQLEGEEAEVQFDCEKAVEMVCVGIRLTRCHYAWLMGMSCQLPQRFTQKHWKQPKDGATDEAAMQLGAKLCAGLEAAFLQGTRSATAALRWPCAKVSQVVLPKEVPWSADEKFTKCLKALKPSPGAAAIQRAFLQQSDLEAPFRPALMEILQSEALAGALRFEDFWRDTDDADDWLQVSAEDLDREMMERQAEFDAYDKRKASGKKQHANQTADAQKLQADMMALGKQLSGLLARDSSVEGVDAATAEGDERSDDGDSESGSEDLNVLGMEEDNEEDESSGDEEPGSKEAGSLNEYMMEMDEQLESVLDGGEEAQQPGDGGLPLHSHHIKVHGDGPLELDVHAMEHVLASYCSEHQLSPGPASLLLGELGLTKPGASPSADPCFLSAMD